MESNNTNQPQTAREYLQKYASLSTEEISEKIQKTRDRELLVDIIKLNPEIYLYLPLEYQIDDELILKVIKKNVHSSFFEYLPQQKKTPQYLLSLIKRGVDFSVLRHFGMFSKIYGFSDDFMEALIEEEKLFEELCTKKISSDQFYRLVNRNLKNIIAFYDRRVEELNMNELEDLFKKETNLTLTFENWVSVCRDNEIVKLKGIKSSLSMIKYATERLKSDFEFCKKALIIQPLSLEYMSKDIQNNQELVKIAVQREVSSFQFASPNLRKDEGFILKLLDLWDFTIQHVSEELTNSKNFLIKALNKKKYSYEFFPEKCRSDYSITMAAVKRYGMNLKYASNELRNNKQIVLTSLHFSCGSSLEFASEELKNDTEVVRFAMRGNEKIFRFASEQLKGNKEFVKSLLSKHGGCIEFASIEFRNDPDVMFEAITNRPELAKYATTKLLMDKNFIWSLILQTPTFVMYVNQSCLSIKDCIALNTACYQYFVEKDNEVENNFIAISAPFRESASNFLLFPDLLKKNDEFLFQCVIKNSFVFELLDTTSEIRNNKTAICFSKRYIGGGFTDEDRKKCFTRGDWHIFKYFRTLNFYFK